MDTHGTGRPQTAARDPDARDAALIESEERFRATFSQAAVGVTHVAPDGRWLMVNERFSQIVGYSRDELLRQTVQELTHPDDRPRDNAERARLFSGEIGWYTVEKRYIRKGGEVIWVNVTRSLVREADGSPKYAITFVEDISDRKRYEHELRASLEHAERITRQLELQRAELRRHAAALMESNADLEDFAYIASHDLKEPLRGISTSAEFLLDDAAESLDADARARLLTIVRLSGRMYTLLDSLLEYSRVGRSELAFEPTDLNAVVAGVLESLQARLEGAQVTVRGPLPTLRCDRVRVGQIFSNLIANAVKYNERADKRVEIGAVEGEPTPTLYVKDNGIGIRPEHHATIFRMFKRLHHRDRYGGGTGAGLTIVKRIVERHGGRVWLSSSPGEGTTFYFTLGPGTAFPEGRGQR
jgi:PAS domain S-box-containing protein